MTSQPFPPENFSSRNTAGSNTLKIAGIARFSHLNAPSTALEALAGRWSRDRFTGKRETGPGTGIGHRGKDHHHRK